jgi:hypothetical protein
LIISGQSNLVLGIEKFRIYAQICFHESQFPSSLFKKNDWKEFMHWILNHRDIKNQHTSEDQWNRIKDPDMNSPRYTHLIIDKGAKTYNAETTASLTNVAEKTGYLPAEN